MKKRLATLNMILVFIAMTALSVLVAVAIV